jgi:glycosyltransferase involved in cell wall biosynthesis
MAFSGRDGNGTATGGASLASIPPTVSVIVAVYNAQDTIGDCLQSLLALEYPSERWELLVVDNASRDATPRILEQYRSRLTILHESIRGPAAARNAGIRSATGELVAFTDADCLVDPRWLRHLVVPLADPAVAIAGGQILAHRPCTRVAEFGERIHDHRRAIEDVVPPYAITMNWASPRRVLHTLGLFDPRLLRCSDVDFAFRVVQAGYRMVYAPGAVIYHRNRSTPRALAWEGYRHGYHGVAVVALHRQFMARYEKRDSLRPRWSPLYPVDRIRSGARSMVQIAATRRELPLALLFNSAKMAGRLAGQVAAALRRLGASPRQPSARRS